MQTWTTKKNSELGVIRPSPRKRTSEKKDSHIAFQNKKGRRVMQIGTQEGLCSSSMMRTMIIFWGEKNICAIFFVDWIWEEEDDMDKMGVHTHKLQTTSCACKLVFGELKISHNYWSCSPSFGKISTTCANVNVFMMNFVQLLFIFISLMGQVVSIH